MSIIGKSLAHYEITAEIGKGGMGEVYRATDTKLGRDVAIKVLPKEFAKDSDRIARFQREARLLATLNHPNIAAIHGLEEADDTHFLVMELIEGDTLANRIKSGPIPVEEALKLALQITEALEAAHEKGVIHRDLKPANIKITPENNVKILDFGLAKAYAGDPQDINLSNSPTLSDAATMQGVILGTAAYMPPEQAKGKTVDKRADIWAFGAVLFEMLTGRQLFTGETVSETLASVIKSEPEWQSRPPNLHSRIRFLLERCLKKEPKDRYSGINDARVDIQEVLSDPGGVFAQRAAAVEPGAKSRQMLFWASATVILIIIVGIIIWNLKPAPESEPPQVLSFSYELPEDVQLDSGGLNVSPDGRKFVYATNEGFYLQSLDELEPRIISETDERPISLFFSPDGRWIGYASQSDRQLKRRAVSGGAPVVICDVGAAVIGADWYEEDTIVFSQVPDGIMRVSARGGTPEPLMKSDITKMDEVGFPVAPQMLPDGKTLLYTAAFSMDLSQAKVMLYSLETGDREELFNGAIARYLPTGHIIYVLGGVSGLDVFAVPFDLDKLEVTGNSIPMLEEVARGTVSESGTLMYVSQTAITQVTSAKTGITTEPGRTLVWVDRKGHEETIQAPKYAYRSPGISPDGTKVVLTASVIEGNPEIYTFDLKRGGNLTRVTFNEGRDGLPLWTPNSREIVFSSTRKLVNGGVFRKRADGTGDAELIGFEPLSALFPNSWSGDGKTLVAARWIPAGLAGDTQKMDIVMLPIEGDHKIMPLLHGDYNETQPQVSPDGCWIAYSSNEADPEKRSEVYLRPFPKVNEGREQVSTEGGSCPRWSPDSRKLFYLVGANVAEKVMSVSVETEPTLRLGKPEVLFEGKFVGPLPNNGNPWDIHPDGDRFLMMKETETTKVESISEKSTEVESPQGETAAEKPLKINIIVNWFEVLKDRVPVE
jgi:serine/threonine protein kinase/dipeptidyl aminopeptidase/acylaminoacyl peptidase